MKRLTPKYLASLERYLLWERVTTPASGSFQETRKRPVPIIVSKEGLTAAEVLFTWETHGKPTKVLPEEESVLVRYSHGKAQRDYWTKEIGWWNKHGAYIPEEFLDLLTPEPFYELFGRYPIDYVVRGLFDNEYTDEMFSKAVEDKSQELRILFPDWPLDNALRNEV